MNTVELAAIELNFSPQGLMLLNLVLGIVIFGIAIDLRPVDFRRVLDMPRAIAAGAIAQFLVLPAATFGLIQILNPAPVLALGMILVAACPGGNISNFVTHLAKGNTALSVSMTAISTILATLMTPLNFSFWGSLDPNLQPLLRAVQLDFWSMLKMIALMLGLPLALGMTLAARKPLFAARLHKPMQIFSFVAFFAFVIAALIANWPAFLNYWQLVAGLVIAHNLLAFGVGYGMARALGLPERETRAATIEVGIQNSGLGLILVFNFFAGLGGMALIAAAWGIWHIFAGACLAGYWSRRPPPPGVPASGRAPA